MEARRKTAGMASRVSQRAEGVCRASDEWAKFPAHVIPSTYIQLNFAAYKVVLPTEQSEVGKGRGKGVWGKTEARLKKLVACVISSRPNR